MNRSTLLGMPVRGNCDRNCLGVRWGRFLFPYLHLPLNPARWLWILPDREQLAASESRARWRVPMDAHLQISSGLAFWLASRTHLIYKAAHADVHDDAEGQKRKQHR